MLSRKTEKSSSLSAESAVLGGGLASLGRRDKTLLDLQCCT